MSHNPLPIVLLQAHLLRDILLILVKSITVIKWEAIIGINWQGRKFKLCKHAPPQKLCLEYLKRHHAVQIIFLCF